jgi:hypothetical protein
MLWLPVWAGGLYAALLLEAVPGDFGHDWCGPWGCWPPIQALVALHLFWVVLFAPPIVWACRTCQPLTLRRLGGLLTTLGLLGVALVAAREAVTWYPHMPAEYRRYFGRRVVYALAMLTDLPVVQLIMAGAVCRVAARRKRRPAASAAAAV